MKRIEKKKRKMEKMQDRKSPLQIGDVNLDNPFIAAPLAGITDAPTRSLCKAMGASLVYSEMVSGKGLLFKNKNTEDLLRIYEEEKPVAYQIFGSDPKVMEETARQLDARENAILDINMGCPVPKVVKNGEGSAMLKNIVNLHDVAEAVVKGSSKPVTAKIRIGWDAESIVAKEAAMALEAAGVSAVAVHGRTREQYYSGEADWSRIAEVKNAVSIPVIGNGDIFNAEDGLRMLEETSCDFVMVARGMLGNPWIFRELVAAWKKEEIPEKPSLDEKCKMMIKHLDLLVKEKGEVRAVREMRKHVGWYLKGVHGATAIRREVNQINEVEILKEAINSIS